MNVLLALGRPLQLAGTVLLALGGSVGGGADYVPATALHAPAPALRTIATLGFASYRAVVRATVRSPQLRARVRRSSNLVYWTSGGAWKNLAPCFGLGFSFPWQPSTKLNAQPSIPWGVGERVDWFARAPWEPLKDRDRFIDAPWPSFEPINVTATLPWVGLDPRDLEAWSPWQPRFTQRLDLGLLARYRYPAWKDRAWELDWRLLASYGLDRSSRLPYYYPPQKDRRFMELPWGPGGPPDYSVHYELPPVVEPLPRNPPPSYVCFDLNRPLQPASNVRLRLRRPLRTFCDNGSFIVNNSLNVITLIDGLNLECVGVSLKLDISSFAWDISLTLATHGEYLRVKPSALQDGAREVQITINGYVWRGFIDTVTVSREFGNPSYTAQGRSFSAYGAAPFAPLTSLVSTTDELAQQLVNDAFQYSTFSITWDTLDWIVPAGLLSYENKDPMGVAAQLCEAIGAFILPGRYDKSFTVRSRYPVTIWHWNDPGTPVTGHIALNQMINASSRFQAGVDYTKVYVSGTEIGNTVGCTRDGTAGDSQSPPITSPLLATDEAATERGRVELSRAGSRILNTYVTPLVAATASGTRLREVGELVTVDEDELDDMVYKGLVTSVQVDGVRTNVGELTVYQTLEVERYVEPVVSL